MNDPNDTPPSSPSGAVDDAETLQRGGAEEAEPSGAFDDIGERSAPGRGTQVGRYVILKAVGEGGMGVVYAAYDPQLDRKVALKLLRPHEREADRTQARARLLREARAMARVSHPNVCPVFDVGTFGHQVFVTMEMIDGPTLHGWLEQPRSWREVLRVMLQAGQGLQAAHEAGLVHRDFKPANILIGSNGRAYVTDFGLARLTVAPVPLAEDPEESLSGRSRPSAWNVTQAGTVTGTPVYMPPEQYLDRAPDARSDQFSFCVVLYEALYRQRPFSPDQMFKAAAALIGKKSTDPRALDVTPDPPPREVKVPAWVQAALARGLSPRAEARFPSVKALLDELSQEPRRIRRLWALGALGAALVGAAAVAGVIQRRGQVCAGSEQLVAEVWNADARHKLEVAFAGTGKPFAADAVRSVTDALDRYAQAWAHQHTGACLATRVQGTQTEELLSKRVVCLERRRKDLRALVHLFTEADEKVVLKAADAASALPSLSECEDVESLSNQVDLPSDPVLRAEIEALGTKLSEMKALLDAGKYKTALEQALPLEQRAASAGYRPLLAEVRYYTGILRLQMGDGNASALLLEQAFNDAEAGRVDRMKVRSLGPLIYVQGTREQWQLAEQWERVANATLTRLGDDETLAIDLLTNLGNLAVLRNRFQEARGYLEKASALQEKLLPAEHPKRARTKFLLGTVSLHLGDEARAVELFSDALRQTEAALGKEHPDNARRHLMLASALTKVDEHDRGLGHARAARRILSASVGPKHPLMGDAMDAEGLCLLGLKRYDEALAVYRDSLALKQEVLGLKANELQYSYDGIGQALLGQGKTREAVPVLEKAVSFTEAQPQDLGESGFALAQALWAERQYPRALAVAKQARARLAEGTPKRAADVDVWLRSHPSGAGVKASRPRRR